MKDVNELTWRTSARSGGGSCVEIATDGKYVYMRHSKDPAGPILTFDREAFGDFIAYLKTGALDA